MTAGRALLRFAQSHRIWIIGAASCVLLGLTIFALHELLAHVRLHEVKDAFRTIGRTHAMAAIALTAFSYWMLTYYDVLALRVIGRPLPYRVSALASFASFSLSHNLGLSLFTGGSARFRYYSAAGLGAGEIVRVVALVSCTFWVGTLTVAAAAMAFLPHDFSMLHVAVDATVQRVVGITLLVLLFGTLGYLTQHGPPARAAKLGLPRLDGRHMVLLLGTSALDLAAATAALAVLVPGFDWSHFGTLYLAFALAITIGQVMHVPGGLGVFEAVILAVAPTGDRAELLAALLAYRLIYYLLPLVVAGIVMAVLEQRRLRAPLSLALDATSMISREVAPALFAALTFGGGVVLLVSGSLPAIRSRMAIIHELLPLPFVEASHIAASLIGAGLLLLAPGLFRRLDGASVLTRFLLLGGGIFSLLKGIDFEEATILFVIAALLHLCRHAFYRKTVLTTAMWTPQWIAAIAAVAVLSSYIGFFAYRHVDYSNELWWQFAWTDNASRFMRASFAVAVLLIAFAYRRLVSGAGGRVIADDDPQFEPDAIVAQSSQTDSFLALTGDKRMLVSEDGAAFLMYQIQSHSWIVMGDPVGPRECWHELLWRIRELAYLAQGRVMLYQISAEALPHAVELGLQIVKYGEEAIVDLTGFSIEGSAMRSLRHCVRRAEREGASFEILPAADVPAHMADLRAVSDAWTQHKGGHEKLFSVGRFDPAYLARFDCALIRAEGRIVAFANIWATQDGQELSVDLMRWAKDLPYGAMDLLFVRLMQWGRGRGFVRFNLGIAPLSGIEARRLSPLWAKAGALLYRHGDALYGFEGLRAYKDKFGPKWSPRYAAAPQGLGLVRALVDLQTLIGGGPGSAGRKGTLKLVA